MEQKEVKEYSRSAVSIDPERLDRECIRLPSDYLKFANLSADCRREVDILKAKLDVVQSEVSKKVRDRPAVFGLEKATEAAISGVVAAHKDYRAALSQLQEAKHRADLAQAAVWALEHKKRSLTLLVELHGMGWFSNPKISERGKEAVERMNARRRPRPFNEED